jgi:hypothetical protein
MLKYAQSYLQVYAASASLSPIAEG